MTFGSGPFDPDQGHLVNAGETIYRGAEVIEIRNTANNNPVYVAANGKPYPIAFLAGTKKFASLRFDHWD